MRVSYHPGYLAEIPQGHVFPMGKFPGLRGFLLKKNIVRERNIINPRPVLTEHLLTVHTPRYVDAILNGNLEKKEARRLGLPWSESLAIRSQLAVQGTLNAAMMALEDGVAGNLAGGTHHAFSDFGEGFCVFNDVAVAIRVLKQSLWVKKVLIIDLDVHQGNGTAAIFHDDPDVYTFSMHGEKNFPFRKPPSTRDVGLPDKTTDKVYLETLETHLNDILAEFSPDLVFYLGGIDPLETDRFGRLSLTLNGLRERDRMVLRLISSRELPIVLLLSGGYAPTVEQTVQAHAIMYEEAVIRYSIMM
ncbi:MAG: histone deacetylase [Bacteroidetes bacterium]|nr:histone deacetylase [Bacteroidota bacterium]MCH8523534.1 histone deacetylase [Balneolales bacterium]